MAPSMEVELRERVTRLEANLEHVRDDVSETKKTVYEIHNIIQQAKGSRWGFYVGAGLAGLIGSKLTAAISTLIGVLPK